VSKHNSDSNERGTRQVGNQDVMLSTDIYRCRITAYNALLSKHDTNQGRRVRDSSCESFQRGESYGVEEGREVKAFSRGGIKEEIGVSTLDMCISLG
jgi:hypothetical protein